MLTACAVRRLIRLALLPAFLAAPGEAISVSRVQKTDALNFTNRSHDESDRKYTYKTYSEIMSLFEDIERRCPDIVELFVAQEAFPEILPSKETWAYCEGQPCKTLIVRVGNKQKMTNTTPEVFFSGALHGDERIGPITVTELADFLCTQYMAGNEEVQHLVDTRNTWIMPMTNAVGYAQKTRRENGMDPNRDFPYMQDPSQCMTTQTARAVNELFRRHLFQFMITFHGGMRALTYEWGSPNHRQGGWSTESPDDLAFSQVGQEIQEAAGRDQQGDHFYPLGRINDMVYPVNGGMEDWSYAAGWETGPITPCRPETYGGYDESRTRYAPGSVGTLVYLAEMDDQKTPSQDSLGRAAQVFGADPGHGHVPRNMRMCLKLIELARPELVVQRPTWGTAVSRGSELRVGLRALGCLRLSTARLLLVPRASAQDCGGLPGLQGGGSAEARGRMLAQALEVAALRQPAACQGLSIFGGSTPLRASWRRPGQRVRGRAAPERRGPRRRGGRVLRGGRRRVRPGVGGAAAARPAHGPPGVRLEAAPRWPLRGQGQRRPAHASRRVPCQALSSAGRASARGRPRRACRARAWRLAEGAAHMPAHVRPLCNRAHVPLASVASSLVVCGRFWWMIHRLCTSRRPEILHISNFGSRSPKGGFSCFPFDVP
ncbi:unnamed protein product [Prorocentrum cordatum]|uniref:Peptidase M14 domain-containing protein n=1 Tax=Prorocentrum cordatum TaxID=2364126 RepID=A0ABN9TL05_9DINO|nr:unnamed protein product [Polarella glacialis]